ncbi:hypothetical protein C8F01DRAFT_1178504 [Mycena amicta]|nr:hypothetical protein C8F01DRAFT_1178504 [Mycena amicta]
MIPGTLVVDCCPSTIQADCTDQCVVVACDEGNDCNLICEDDCLDCDGFDQFLRCCTDLHAYYEEPHHPELANQCTWNALGCCGTMPSETLIPVDDSDSPFFVPSQFSTPPGSHSPGSVADSVDGSAASCLWGNCAAVLADLSELVQHVNTVHLRNAPMPAPTAPDIFPTSCQWKDCNIYPTPNTIPGPSSGDVDSILGVLSSHLLHDHLGLNALPTPPQESSSKVEFSPNFSPSPSSSSGDGHTCCWVGCGQSFPSLEELTQHLTSVHVGSGRTSYDCFWSNCNRHDDNGFSSKQKLCRHLQSHTGHRPFQCKVCMQNFSEAATLQQHMRRHTQEKPYACDHPGCGKSFAITGALTIHKRTHNGDKPFKCPHCFKPFSESSNLSKHLRTHSGVKPYTCSEPGCGKSFARADQLTRHGRVHRKVSNS